MKIVQRTGWAVVAVVALGAVWTLRAETPPVSPPAGPPASPGDQLVLLDGQTISALLISISEDGALSGEGVPEGLTLDDLRQVTRSTQAEPSAPTRSPATLELIGGGRIFAQGVTIAEDVCHVRLGEGNEIALPIDVVRAIRFGQARPSPAFEKALTESSDSDRIFVKLPDEDPAKPSADQPVQAISGLVLSLSASAIVFEWQGAEHTTPLDRLYGIVAAQVVDEGREFSVLAHLQDGAALPAESARLEGDALTLAISPVSETKVPWASVTRLDIRSPRLVFLSDLEPAEAVGQALVTYPRPWRRDKSVGNRPLTLRGAGPASNPNETTVFEKGIGVHAYSRLAFDTEGASRFAAMIGIDAETEGRGDCVFRVLGDGQTLFEQRMKGADPARPVNVDVRGAAQVTLVVEPGEDLDLSDHADWADARFIRTDTK